MLNNLKQSISGTIFSLITLVCVAITIIWSMYYITKMEAHKLATAERLLNQGLHIEFASCLIDHQQKVCIRRYTQESYESTSQTPCKKN